jgi:hypothetical protein
MFMSNVKKLSVTDAVQGSLQFAAHDKKHREDTGPDGDPAELMSENAPLVP